MPIYFLLHLLFELGSLKGQLIGISNCYYLNLLYEGNDYFYYRTVGFIVLVINININMVLKFFLTIFLRVFLSEWKLLLILL